MYYIKVISIKVNLLIRVTEKLHIKNCRKNQHLMTSMIMFNNVNISIFLSLYTEKAIAGSLTI